MKFSLFDVVVLADDMPEINLRKGMKGTVVEIYSLPNEAYEVEFCDSNGQTLNTLALSPEQIHSALKKLANE